VLDRMTVLATEAGDQAKTVSTIVAWVLCILAVIGIGIAYVRWR
jgi:hypothetical protein